MVPIRGSIPVVVTTVNPGALSGNVTGNCDPLSTGPGEMRVLISLLAVLHLTRKMWCLRIIPRRRLRNHGCRLRI